MGMHCVGTITAHSEKVLALTVDGARLYSGGDSSSIRVWDLQLLKFELFHKKRRALNGHTDAVVSLLIQDGLLISGSFDCTIRLWDVQNMRCVSRLKPHTGRVLNLVCMGAL